jgi:hypothetical protein
MAIYIDVPVREDRLAEVFKLLSTEPGDPAAPPAEATDDDHPDQSLARDDERNDDKRDDERWDAFWAVPDNVREHIAARSDRIRAIHRAIAEHAGSGRWINGDEVAAEIGDSPSSVASALGPYARYLQNRKLAWAFRWRYASDKRIEYQAAPEVAAVMLDIL